MNGVRYLFLILCCCALQVKAGGDIINLQFIPQYNGRQIQLDEMYYPLPGGDSIMFETFRCYISGMRFFKNGALVLEENNSYHLLDMADTQTMQITVNTPNSFSYDAVQFNMGIDSTANTSGAQDGALDPVKGMYWAWQTGYINLKLEGKSNKCKTRHNAFSFHLGGYLPPFYAIQQVQLPAIGKYVAIQIPLDKFVNKVDLAKQNSIMIPCKEAVELSKTIAGLFETKR